MIAKKLAQKSNDLDGIAEIESFLGIISSSKEDKSGN
jgi:hypothetical protein